MQKLIFTLGVLMGIVLPAFSQSFSCPPGTEDVLNYVIMGYPQRLDNYMGPGNANPIYSYISPDNGAAFAQQGYLVWIKGSNGSPWDVKAFDSNFVYDRTTEYNWNDPYSFRRWNVDVPMFRRCVATNKDSAAIMVPSNRTNYGFYLSCTLQQTMNLGYVVNSITRPALVNTRGNLGVVSTRYFRYKYGCNSHYGNCSDMEVFSLGYQVGLYDWKHYVNQNGTFVLVQDASINSFDVGQTTPNLPCPNSYQ